MERPNDFRNGKGGPPTGGPGPGGHPMNMRKGGPMKGGAPMQGRGPMMSNPGSSMSFPMDSRGPGPAPNNPVKGRGKDGHFGEPKVEQIMSNVTPMHGANQFKNECDAKLIQISLFQFQIFNALIVVFYSKRAIPIHHLCFVSHQGLKRHMARSQR